MKKLLMFVLVALWSGRQLSQRAQTATAGRWAFTKTGLYDHSFANSSSWVRVDTENNTCTLHASDASGSTRLLLPRNNPCDQ